MTKKPRKVFSNSRPKRKVTKQGFASTESRIQVQKAEKTQSTPEKNELAFMFGGSLIFLLIFYFAL